MKFSYVNPQCIFLAVIVYQKKKIHEISSFQSLLVLQGSPTVNQTAVPSFLADR